MSADEIRMLAEDCEKEAKHIDKDAEISFLNGNLRLKNSFDIISEMERKKAVALLAYAAMIERCENEIAKLRYPPSADDVVDFKRLNYILRGDARKERRDDNRRKDNRVNLHGCFDV